MASDAAVPQNDADVANSGESAMDFKAHEQTYEGFIHYSIVGAITIFTILVALVLFAFGGGAGFWLGVLTVLVALGGLAIGLATGGAWKPAIGGLVVGCLFVILTVSG